MRPMIRFLFYVNISFELLFPLFSLLLTGVWNRSLTNQLFSEQALLADVFLAFFLSYLFYATAIVKVNIRRFPRVIPLALVVLFVPLITEGLLWFLLGLTGKEAFFVLGVHYFTAYLLAMFFEAIQRSRVRAVEFPPFVAGLFLASGTLSLIFFHLLALPILFAGQSQTESLYLLLAWILGLALIASVKFYQAGKRLYAGKGYRPNSAVIVINELGEVLLCERAGAPGRIQTVQGGIDPGETPEEAARRELTEELGLWPHQYELKGSLLKTERYDWAYHVQQELRHTGYKGQEQYFFLVQVSSDAKFDLAYHHREFSRVWWAEPEDLLKLSWSKKRPGIKMALEGFGLI